MGKLGPITIAVKCTLRSSWETLIDEDNQKEVKFREEVQLVEILFDQEELSIEWAIFDLVFIYGYNLLSNVEIIKYWLSDVREVQLEPDAESNRMDSIEAGGDIPTLSKGRGRKKLSKKPLPRR